MSELEQRALVVAIGTRKGGAGKTTIANSVAAELARQGHKVLLMDCDKQRSTGRWVDRRNESIDDDGMNISRIACVEKLGKVKPHILEQAKNYDVVVVDPAGLDNVELRQSMLAADLLFMPTQVSQYDLEILEEMAGLIDEVKDYNEELKAFCFINDAPTDFGAREIKEAKDFIGEFSDSFGLCKTIVKSRKAYRTSPRDGRSVIESSDTKAKAEIQLLVKEILSHG